MAAWAEKVEKTCMEMTDGDIYVSSGQWFQWLGESRGLVLICTLGVEIS